MVDYIAVHWLITQYKGFGGLAMCMDDSIFLLRVT
jgi:hypothetical protein